MGLLSTVQRRTSRNHETWCCLNCSRSCAGLLALEIRAGPAGDVATKRRSLLAGAGLVFGDEQSAESRPRFTEFLKEVGRTGPVVDGFCRVGYHAFTC